MRWVVRQSAGILVLIASLGCAVVAAESPQRPRPALPAGVKLIPNLEYASVNGQSLLMDLYLPKPSDQPVPVILYVHGGGWIGGNRHDGATAFAATQGYAMASIEYRLSNVATYPAQIQDCKAAVRWLRAHADFYNLDRGHIGAFGVSAGGHLVALLGTTPDVKELEGDGGNLDQSSRVQAVCDWFGPADFITFSEQAKAENLPELVDPNSAKSLIGRLLGGGVLDNKELALSASPTHFVSKQSAPFLIMHGDKDPLVPLAQSQELHDALKKAGVEVRLEVIHGAGHGFGGPKIRDSVMAFFDRHLKVPKPSTRPATQPAPAH